MSERIKQVEQKSGTTLRSVLSENKLVFSLQKLTVKQTEHYKQLWIHGVDQNGFSVAIKISDFQPTFMIKSPDQWDECDDIAADELVELMDDVNNKLSTEDDTGEKIQCAEFVRMSPFIGFTNSRQDRMVRFTCRNINDYGKVVKYLKALRYTLYHDDFNFTNQFLQQTGKSYQDWYVIEPFKVSNQKLTYASIEGYTFMNNIFPYTGKLKVKIPPTIKAFFRIKAVSRDGVVEKKYGYHANPELPFDRIIAMSLAFTWSNDETSTPFIETVFTTIPEESDIHLESRPIEYLHFATEAELIAAFRLRLVKYDPDDIFYFPDTFDSLNFYATRAKVQNVSSALKIDRFRNAKAKTIVQNESITSTRVETRNMFNMEAALKKKVFISVESYDLYTCSCHSKFRKPKSKKPFVPAERWEDLITDNNWINTHMAQGHSGRRKIIAMLLQDMRLLIALERDMGMRLEYANVCKASDTDLTDVVSRGEQIRVFNKLTHFCIDNLMYVNREKIAQKPKRFRITDRPPTFTDPIEPKMNTRLREECKEYLAKKLLYHTPKKASRINMEQFQKAMAQFNSGQDDDDDKDEESIQHAKDDEEEAEGGNVMKPSCKFWDNQRIFIWDFKSLYPSIMMAFNLSYENVVYDEEYLDLPNVNYMFIAINKYETVAVADVPGLIPKMLRMLVDNRDAIKKKMKAESDEFRKKVYDFEQNSMKILCNATYGFCGAEKRGAMLAMKEIMYMVTSLGRYLQKECAAYVAHKYNIHTIYGDSVTADTPILCRLNNRVFYTAICDIPRDAQLPDEGDKELFRPVDGLEVWSDQGWTSVKSVIKHETDKRIYRVLTQSGRVDVTADHSLLDSQGRCTDPEFIKVGSTLLHHPLPPYMTNNDEKGVGTLVDQANEFWRLSSSSKNADANAVISVVPLPAGKRTVYDLETENHHFAAGVGKLVVHNTDSIFTLIHLWDPPADPETGIVPIPTIEQLCEETGKLYEMQDFFGQGEGFTWPQVVQHYAKKVLKFKEKDRYDVTQFSFQHQVNAFLYLISEKLCDELTARFRYPVIMEFENMADKCWMGWVKKHYCYRLWNIGNPSQIDYIKITGMPVKKREWSPWTRGVLMGVTKRILNDELDEIKSFLTKELDELIEGKVPIKRLMISKGYKNKAAYKHFRQIHLQIMLKIEERNRWPVRENSRVYFVVVSGKDKLYLRAETPEYAVEHELELDMEYYLRNQFEKPMRKLLTYHPELLNFDELYKQYTKRLKLRTSNLSDLGSFQNSKKRKLTMAEILAKRRKTAKQDMNRKRKRVVESTGTDRFSSLVKRLKNGS